MKKLFEPDILDKVFCDEAAVNLQQQIDTRPSARLFIQEIQRDHSRSPLLKGIIEVAGFIEPQHRYVDLGAADYSAANAFYSGAVVAFGGLLAYTNWQQHTVMANLELEVPDPSTFEDEFDFRHKLAASMVDLGHEGYRTAEAYEELFGDIEDEVSPNAAYLGVAKAGFGLPFYMLQAAFNKEVAAEAAELRAKHLTELEKQAETASSYNWDAGLASLLEGNT